MKFDVVIAGGGFAGAYCAKVLGKALGVAGVKRVALIAERNVLVFQPMLAEVAGAANRRGNLPYPSAARRMPPESSDSKRPIASAAES